MALERLQKIMAWAGVASRRKSEELITAGRVTVNGQPVSELGTKADPERDHIRVDGKLLHGSERKLYLLLNKPRGYVTTVSDPEGRPTVMHLLRDLGTRVYPVGRLDYASEGLLLLTNDGELAQKLTRAASHVAKTYLVKVSGRPSIESISRLREGVVLRGERPGERPIKTAPARITIAREAENPWYEVTLTEGRNRQIRRMFEQVGHRVEKIKRVRYGPLELDVPPGEYRHLTPEEVERLRSGGGPPRRRENQDRSAVSGAARRGDAKEQKPSRARRAPRGKEERHGQI
jgi:23S rRNA pseudouridine2605 synthase